MTFYLLSFFTDASGLKEAEHVRDSQEKVVAALQEYTALNYPSMPSKFGELLLRIPELQRVCQVSDSYLVFRRMVSIGESFEGLDENEL